MTALLADVGLVRLAVVVAAAAVAGFVTGLAGFGTGLTAIGIWLQVLPTPLVPPLVVLNSVTGQLGSLPVIRRVIRWRALAPYLLGGLVGVPLGVLALERASPGLLRPAIGVCLIAFVVSEHVGGRTRAPNGTDRHAAAALVGAGSGFLGGFMGLSGPLLIVWLRLRGGSPDHQRAIYQPFNLLVLLAAALTLGSQGHLDWTVLLLAGICLPATLIGARFGAHCYRRIDAVAFRWIVHGLLFASGLALLLFR